MVAGTGTQTLIRAVAVADRAVGQHGPELLSRILQHVDKPARLVTQIPYAVFSGQAHYRQQNASLPLI